jgi:uncharacterized membrane protein
MIPAERLHPMLVHFPLALYPAAIALDLWILARGGDLAARQPVPQIAVLTYVVATLLTLATLLLGGIAFDAALAKGFAEAPLEAHEEAAKIAFFVFAAVTVLRLYVYFRRIAFGIRRGGAGALVSLAACGIMLFAAYRGGELVYSLGVNVASVAP